MCARAERSGTFAPSSTSIFTPSADSLHMHQLPKSKTISDEQCPAVLRYLSVAGSSKVGSCRGKVTWSRFLHQECKEHQYKQVDFKPSKLERH